MSNKEEVKTEQIPKSDAKNETKSAAGNVNNLPIRAYLDKTVIPLVLQGMAEVAKERPENPIKYLADFLMKHSNDK